MKINNIFYSIQGEGLTIGQPAVFVRLSGCLLKCTWCDSKYHTTINSDFSEQTILDLLKKKPNCNRIIFTGGEPLLQQEAICEFLIKNYMVLKGKNIEFETNGLVLLEPKIKTMMKNKMFDFHFNVSPKLFSSGNKITGCLYDQFKNLDSVIFKFVYVQNYFFEIEDFIQILKIPKNKVYIMPEGSTKVEQEKSMKNVVDFCKTHGYNFTPRLHILIWDDKRGV